MGLTSVVVFLLLLEAAWEVVIIVQGNFNRYRLCTTWRTILDNKKACRFLVGVL